MNHPSDDPRVIAARANPDHYRAEVQRMAQRAAALRDRLGDHLPRCDSPGGRCAAAATILRASEALESHAVIDYQALNIGLSLAERHVAAGGGA